MVKSVLKVRAQVRGCETGRNISLTDCNGEERVG